MVHGTRRRPWVGTAALVGARRRLRTGPLHTFSLVLAPSPHSCLSPPPPRPAVSGRGDRRGAARAWLHTTRLRLEREAGHVPTAPAGPRALSFLARKPRGAAASTTLRSVPRRRWRPLPPGQARVSLGRYQRVGGPRRQEGQSVRSPPPPVLTSTISGTWRGRTRVPPAPTRSLQDGARGAWGTPVPALLTHTPGSDDGPTGLWSGSLVPPQVPPTSAQKHLQNR